MGFPNLRDIYPDFEDEINYYDNMMYYYYVTIICVGSIFFIGYINYW